MLNKLMCYLHERKDMQSINTSLAKASAALQVRKIDPANPTSWEFSGFSQNGEDGIIDYLTSKIIGPNYYFIEIGASNGLENNTSWLAIVKKYNGLMIESNPKDSLKCRQIMLNLAYGTQCLSLFLDKDNALELSKCAQYKDPDFFSLDIDGNDYYIAQALLGAGFKPKVWSVEYNSAFGPDNAVTIKYDKDFCCSRAHESKLYYGVSIMGWRRFFAEHGYKFITVDKNGVNAFFIKDEYFEDGFSCNIKGLDFRENFCQRKNFGTTWEKQFDLVKHMPFVEI